MSLALNRNAVVTGGGTGIGKAIARTLRRNGWEVWVTGRRPDVLRATAEDDGTVLADLSANTGGWSGDTITQVQLKLAAAGLYTSDVDGKTGPGFTAALNGWRNGGFDAEVLGE